MATASRNREIDHLLVPYVPRLVVDWLRGGADDLYRRVEGSLVFVDISGFTKLAERLARKGRIGAEELSDTLNSTFTELLSVAYDYGAGVIKWGGDAVLLLFDGDGHELRACRGAAEMQRALRRIGRIRTQSGTVVLRMSVGINSGAFDFFLVGESHRELLIAGRAATETTLLEAVADAGEIVISAATAARLPSRSVADAKGLGFLLRGLPAAERAPASDIGDVAGLPLATCLPVAIRSHLLTSDREAEHRNIGVAFVEFRGTDALIEEDGGERVSLALHDCIRAIQDSVEHHQVTFHESDISKDGGKILLLSGAPRSAGDDEERMLRAVRAIMDAPISLPLRAGVNFGPVFSGDFGPPYRRTFSVKGDAVNLAARLMGKADTGQIVASEEIVRRSRTVFALEQLEPFFVKGKAAAIRAHTLGDVVGRTTGATATPLIGRDHELAELLAALGSARDWKGRYVEVVGEPGMGKSRLIDELRANAGAASLVSASALEYEAATPYFVLRAPLRSLLGLDGLDDRESAERLATLVSELAPSLLPWLPLIALPLQIEVPATPEVDGLTDEFRKIRVEEVVQELLGLGLLAPTLLVFEDVHWMDDSSRDLLRTLVDHIEDRPWLIVATSRTASGGLQRNELPWAQLIDLEPLGGPDALHMVEEASAEAPLPPHQLDALVQRAEGNPLYLRELITTARQLGGIDQLPDSVGGVIAAQIDRLSAPDRALLRRASVLGADFEAPLLRAIVPEMSSVEFCNRLGEFLQTSAGRFRFRHALVRDTAYEGLPYRRRRELHAVVGEAILAEYGADAKEHAPLLSRHFYEAQRFNEAWRYSARAGLNARDLYANVEAETLLLRAIESARRIGSVSAPELSMTVEALGEVRIRLGDYDRGNAALASARHLLSGNPPEQARLMLRQGAVRYNRAQHSQAIRWVRRALRTIADDQTPEAQLQRARLEAWYGTIRFRQGRMSEAIDLCRRAIAHATAIDARDALAHAYYILDYALVSLGRQSEAVYSERALAIFQELGDLSEEAGVLNNLGAFAYYDGRWQAAIDYYQRAEKTWERAGNRSFASVAAINRGELLSDQGRLAEAEQLFKYVRRIARAANLSSRIAEVGGFYGRLAARAGRFAEARELLDEARSLYAHGGVRVEVLLTDVRIAESLAFERRAAEALAACDEALETVGSVEGVFAIVPNLLRIRGWALLELGRIEEARQVLDASLAQAHDRKSNYDVALTADVLAQLVRADGDENEATELEAVRDSIFDELGVAAPEAVLLPVMRTLVQGQVLTAPDQ